MKKSLVRIKYRDDCIDTKSNPCFFYNKLKFCDNCILGNSFMLDTHKQREIRARKAPKQTKLF